MSQARRDSWKVQHNPFILAAGFIGLFIVRIGPLGNWLWGRYIFTACKVGSVTMEILGTHTVTKPTEFHRRIQTQKGQRLLSVIAISCLWKAVWRTSASFEPTNRTDTSYPQSEFPCAPSPAPLFLTFSFPFLCSSGLLLYCEQSLLGLFFL